MVGSSATMDRALAILGDVFGYRSFRGGPSGGQASAVASICEGLDTIVLLPTGAGKSLCYQVPGLLESRTGGGTTVVISPLIALMQDQVDALRARGVVCAGLHSHLSDDERIDVIRAFSSGELEFLYCSPERASTPSFKRMLGECRIAMIAIDEAHCLSQWGHDFRPEYMRLAEIVELTGAPTIALTATATPRVLDEIAARLGLQDPTVIRGDFSRPNLQFDVEHHRGDATRVQSLVEALENAELRGRKSGGRAIIYCSTRKKTEMVAKELTGAGFDAAYYHAGRTALARERAKKAFDTGRRNVLVATNAFGMGIDYPDVRLIVHFQTPGSLEAYYQEAGRAGRDGQDARCLLYFGRADMVTQQRLASGSSARSGVREQALEAISNYARSQRCRQQVICTHFSGASEDSDERLCERCDVCRCDDPNSSASTSRAAEIAAADERASAVQTLAKADRALISTALGRLTRPVGKRNFAKALRGSKAKSLSRGGLLSMPEYGALSDYTEDSIVAAIDELLSRGVFEVRGQKYPKLWIKGRPVRTRAPRTSGARESTSDRPTSSRRRHHSPITRALDNYRRKRARALKWKPYMVFQKKAIVAIDELRPTSIDQLFKIPGLGPAKVERFGEDILALVRDFR